MSKELWAFWANSFGPSFKGPQKVIKDGSWWWHRDKDHCVSKPGFTNAGWICYAHKDKQKVADFIRGFNAARYIMGQFCRDRSDI